MDEKNKRKNMFLRDKIARKAFCVDGLFYPIIKVAVKKKHFWGHTIPKPVKKVVKNGVIFPFLKLKIFQAPRNQISD